MMFSYRYTAYDSGVSIPDGAKRILGWIGAAVAVGILWTMPGWFMVWGWI